MESTRSFFWNRLCRNRFACTLQGQQTVPLTGRWCSASQGDSGSKGLDWVVKGKPFSATEERHFACRYWVGDGTRIETSQTNRLYRDNEGRTRVEEMNGTIAISDPAAKLRWELDPAAKTAHKANTYLVYDANHGTTRTYSGGWGLPVSSRAGQTCWRNGGDHGESGCADHQRPNRAGLSEPP